MEEWKKVKDYENYYEVSNKGRVRTIARTYKMIIRGTECERKVTSKLLSITTNRYGYLYVSLKNNNTSKHNKKITVHRLVAQAFIPNPNNLCCVNHIDENKLNNNVTNLEWITVTDNNNHGSHNQKISEKLKGKIKSTETIQKIKESRIRIPVIKIDKETGLELAEYESLIMAAKENNTFQNSISNCCKNKPKCKTAGGYKWKFKIK